MPFTSFTFAYTLLRAHLRSILHSMKREVNFWDWAFILNGPYGVLELIHALSVHLDESAEGREQKDVEE